MGPSERRCAIVLCALVTMASLVPGAVLVRFALEPAVDADDPDLDFDLPLPARIVLLVLGALHAGPALALVGCGAARVAAHLRGGVRA